MRCLTKTELKQDALRAVIFIAGVLVPWLVSGCAENPPSHVWVGVPYVAAERIALEPYDAEVDGVFFLFMPFYLKGGY